MIKVRLTIVMLTLVCLLNGCTKANVPAEKNNDSIKGKETENREPENESLKDIDLIFTPVPKEKLIAGKPEQGWERIESIPYGQLPGGKANVNLYLKRDPNASGAGQAAAFIEYDNELFSTGNEISAYGLEGVEISFVDRDSDSINEIEIAGNLGAANRVMKIILYDEENQEWVKLLEIDNPTAADLDNDGSQELASVSMGSVPGFVDIYRWNEDHFEKASVTESAGFFYAGLYSREGKWIIESGQQGEPHFYQYMNGRLIEQAEAG